jgi:hypothetical protein
MTLERCMSYRAQEGAWIFPPDVADTRGSKHPFAGRRRWRTLNTYMKISAACMFAALLAIAPTAVAYADSQDDQFRAALSAQGIPEAPDQLIAAAHTVCDNWGSPFAAYNQFTLMGLGLNVGQRQQFYLDAFRAYCPEKMPVGFPTG